MANRKKQKQILALLLGGILLGSAAGCGEPKGQEPSGDAAGMQRRRRRMKMAGL